MKNNLNILIVILIIILGSTFIFEKIKNNKLKKDNTILSLELNKLDNILQIFKDENGFYRAKAEAAESNLNTIKIVYEEELKNLRKEFTNINKNYRNLNSLYRTSLSNRGELKFKLDSIYSSIDTVYNNGTIDNIISTRKFRYRDQWTIINGTLIFNTSNMLNDNIILTYNVKDSLNFVSYYKRDKIFSKRKLYIEGKSYNPNTSIVNLSQIKINNYKEPKWSLGLQTGYGITQHGTGWYVGMGINRKIINW
jgi:hypothetical protein